MPFNKKKLAGDFFNALGADIPDDDDKTKATVQKIADAMADGVEMNPAKAVLGNEEKIALLEARIEEMEAVTGGFQSFMDELEGRLTTVEANAGGGGA